LSIGKVPAIVVRAEQATLRAQDAKRRMVQTAEGYAARCFQPETDLRRQTFLLIVCRKCWREIVVKISEEKNWK